MYCNNCGVTLKETQKFCHKCGEKVTPVTQKPEAPTAEPESEPVAVPVVETATVPVVETAETPDVGKVETLGERKPRRWVLGCAGALLLLILGIALLASAYYWLDLHKTNRLASILPTDTMALVTVSPGVLQAPQLRHLTEIADEPGVFFPIAAVPGAMPLVQQLSEEFPDVIDLDVTKDILPWIGREISIAFLDPPGSPSEESKPYATAVISAVTRDQARSNRFLEDIRDQLEDEGFTFDESSHEGIQITSIVSPPDVMPVAYATIQDQVVIASDIETIQEVIDRSDEDATALSQLTEFHEVTDALPANRLGYFYISPSETIPDLRRDNYDPFEALGPAAIAFTLSDHGVLCDYALQLESEELGRKLMRWQESAPYENSLASYVPKDTVLYLSSHSLWPAFEAVETRETSDALRSLRNDLDVDLEDDVAAHLQGEFALAILESSDGFLDDEEIPAGLLLLAQTDDKRRAQRDFEDIAQNLAFWNDMRVQDDEFNDADVLLLEDRFTKRGVGYGFGADYFFAGSSKDILETAAEVENFNLASTPAFQNFLEVSGDNSIASGLLNVREGWRLVEDMVEEEDLEEFEESYEQFGKGIEAIGVNVEKIDEEGIIHGVVYIMTSAQK